MKQCGSRLYIPGLPVIICHRHRFIFMHCRKTAGSSIAACLAPFLGPDDLHVGTWPEAFEQGVAPNRRARRDLLYPPAAASFAGRLARRPTRLLYRKTWIAALNGAQRLKYRAALGHSPEHAHASDVRARFPGPWRDYFKFCFVRNPFDRAVSDFIWRTRKTGNTEMTFRDFLQRLERRDFSNTAIPRHFDNWPIYTIDDRIAVDFVGRLERLADDLEEVFARLELHHPPLPHAKRMRPFASYRNWYRNDERSLVERLFANEIRQFGYSF